MRHWNCRCLCLAIILFTQTHSPAQDQVVGKTILEIEILLPSIGGDLVTAQKWGEVFKTMGEGVRLRQGLASDKTILSEKMQGQYRIIKMVGELDRDGTLRFPQKTFTLETVNQLQEWLNEIKAYGAQGAPDGKSNWGMSKTQFDAVVKALSAPVEKPVKGLALHAAIQQLPIPDEHPVVFHFSCDTLLSELKDVALLIEVEGLSVGTSLAAVLSQYGLGFIPLRHPDGSIELRAEPLSQLVAPWSIGWPVAEKTPRNEIFPSMFVMAQAGFDNLPLQDVLAAISVQTKVPILVNQAACLANKIDPFLVQVSYPFKKTAPVLILKTTVRSSKLNYEFRLDEASKPFVYVYPFVPYQAPK